jgi:hypothetical protein
MQVLCMAFDAQPGLTVDNMIKRNWTCDPLCSFYLCMRETFDHLFSQCNYTEAVWNLAAPRLGLGNFSSLLNLDGLTNWIPLHDCFRIKKSEKRKLGIIFTFWWQIWKERNRRIFESQELSVQQLSILIVDEIHIQRAAMQTDP